MRQRGIADMAKAAEKVYLEVRQGILRGVYPAASRLTEQEIASATGVSRTPVREALRRLQAEGYISAAANHGAVVMSWTSEDRNDVFELRALLEPYGAARAAERMTDDGVAELRELAQRQAEESEARRDNFIERVGELNRRFHRLVHEFSGNTRLAKLVPALLETPLILKTFTRYEPSELVRSAAHHLELVNALEARDPEWAHAVMRAHILAAQNASGAVSRARPSNNLREGPQSET